MSTIVFMSLYETHFRKVDAFLEKVKTFQLYIYNIKL